MDYILEKIFTNISLQTYTIIATLLFSSIFFLIIKFFMYVYSNSTDRNQNHIIIKITILFVSLIGGILAQGVVAELYFFKDWECPKTGTCI
ncbi:MAG: hypothetical protein P8K05_03190 [Dehalococcoidia bacterium]|jgi:hypothetical protein|nr:hypothetical protein [Dehalococcoidia bacterium]